MIFNSSQPWKWRSSSVSRKMYSASKFITKDLSKHHANEKKFWFVIYLSKKSINMQGCIWLACHRRSLISWIWSTKKIDSIQANVLSVIPESIRILVDCALKKEWERKLEGIEYVRIVTSIFNCVSYQDSQNMPIKTSHFPLEILYLTINDEVSNISNH